jgi:hypothetical protein
VVPDVTTETGMAQAEALQRNEVARTNFAMAFMTDGLININMLDSVMVRTGRM